VTRCKRVLALLLMPSCLLTGCALRSDKLADGAGLSVQAQADAQKRADIRLQLATAYYAAAQFPVAVAEAAEALRAVPDLAEAYSVRALAYAALGQTAQAENDFRHSLKLMPGNPDFANNFGWFLCGEAAGVRAAEAIPYLEQAANNAAYRSPARALVNAGACSLRVGDGLAAQRYFIRAFQYEPASAVTNLHLSKLYFDQAEFERAQFHLGLAAKNEVLKVDALWLAIRIERKLGNQAAENDLAVQLRRRYPSSPEYAAYQRGAFDE